MSASEHDKAHDAIIQFQKLFADLHKQQLQRQEAERKRRAALTPEQRAAEDRAAAARVTQSERQKLTQKLAKMGDVLRKSDTWTIADFCWLLLAESPADSDSWSFFDGRSSKATKLHREYSAILGSCLHTRLKPVNPADAPEKYRFTVQSLVQVAQEKRLGCVDVLAEVIGLKHQPSPGTAPAPVPADRKPSQVSAAIAAQSPTPQAPRPHQPRARWYGVLSDVLLQIESGARQLGRRLTRDSLPEGAKHLLPIVHEVCERRNVKPPTKHDTLQKQVNALGWGFGGPGVREATGELRRLFDAGQTKKPST